jgi:deoxycytidine triphosphate deaminase
VIIKSNEFLTTWKNLIHLPKQMKDASLDLTIKKLFTFSNQGALDFGGSEYQPIDLQPLTPKVEKDPKYGWWIISQGEYLVEYNEVFSRPNCLAVIFPHQRLISVGCFHPVFIIDSQENSESIQGLLIVNRDGVRIKENARISTAISFAL